MGYSRFFQHLQSALIVYQVGPSWTMIHPRLHIQSVGVGQNPGDGHLEASQSPVLLQELCGGVRAAQCCTVQLFRASYKLQQPSGSSLW
jgi:hypothetical protein